MAACVSIPVKLTHPEVPTLLWSTPDGLWTLGLAAHDFGLPSPDAPAPPPHSSLAEPMVVSGRCCRLSGSDPSMTLWQNRQLVVPILFARLNLSLKVYGAA